jgi:hypothetical protein
MSNNFWQQATDIFMPDLESRPPRWESHGTLSTILECSNEQSSTNLTQDTEQKGVVQKISKEFSQEGEKELTVKS